MNAEFYYLYTKIRYIVEEDHCHKLSAKEVRDKITETDYNIIKKYYGLSRETIDNIIDHAVNNTPPSKIPTRI